MNKPLVSILIPVHNVEAYLPKCLDTVLGQTYSNLQVVLIDDGSMDGSWTIMRDYAAKDSRIEIYHQENQGVAATRNHLLEKIKGEYVLFVDSDDWIELDMVGNLVTLADEYRSGFIMCDRVINDASPNNQTSSIFRLTKEQAIHDFLRHDYFVGSLWNKLLKSSMLHNVKFRCGISYGEDALFCWHVLQNTSSVVVTDQQLYHYRMNEDSISHKPFDEKKFTGHLVWESIVKDVETRWPKYFVLAKAHWALSDTILLWAAAHSGTPRNSSVRTLQQTIIRNGKFMIKEHVTHWRMLLYSVVISRCYAFGRLF